MSDNKVMGLQNFVAVVFHAPFNGDLFQVMCWPFFTNMTDHDLRAIYAYLSAIPCNPGQVTADAPYLQNACE